MYSFTVPEKPESRNELARHGGRFEIFHPFCRANHQNKPGPTQVGAISKAQK